MTVLRNLLIAAAAVSALAACAKPASAGADTVDVAKEEAAIRQMEMAWSADFPSRDVAKLTSHYADDVLLADPINPSVMGLPAARAAFEATFKDPNFSLSFTPDRVVVARSGDLAFSTGHFRATWTGMKDNAPMSGTGVYVTNYVRGADGQWKVSVDFAHGDTAMPAARP